MEPMENNQNTENNTSKGVIHFVLSHSYGVFFLVIIVGTLLDLMFPIKFFYSQIFQYIGAISIVLGSILSYWAQKTTNHTEKEMKIKGVRDFYRGPYKYSRNPTLIGLLMIFLGFGLMIGSFFIITLTVAVFFINKYFFIRREEKLLEGKYGQDYINYKQKVRTWL